MLSVPGAQLGELILDRGFWSWRFAGEASLSLGRQDIIWPGGFLMLEGHPYDGSRSIYHDALRLRAQPGGWRTDLALIHNEKYDPLIIAGDQDRRLTDADESGAALRLTRGAWAWSVRPGPSGSRRSTSVRPFSRACSGSCSSPAPCTWISIPCAGRSGW